MDSSLNLELPPPLATDEAVLTYVSEKVMEVVDARASYNALEYKPSGKPKINRRAQAYWERTYWLKLGAALGAAVMAFRSGRISEVAYTTLVARAMGTAKADESQPSA